MKKVVSLLLVLLLITGVAGTVAGASSLLPVYPNPGAVLLAADANSAVATFDRVEAMKNHTEEYDLTGFKDLREVCTWNIGEPGATYTLETRQAYGYLSISSEGRIAYSTSGTFIGSDHFSIQTTVGTDTTSTSFLVYTRDETLAAPVVAKIQTALAKMPLFPDALKTADWATLSLSDRATLLAQHASTLQAAAAVIQEIDGILSGCASEERTSIEIELLYEAILDDTLLPKLLDFVPAVTAMQEVSAGKIAKAVALLDALPEAKKVVLGDKAAIQAARAAYDALSGGEKELLKALSPQGYAKLTEDEAALKKLSDVPGKVLPSPKTGDAFDSVMPILIALSVASLLFVFGTGKKSNKAKRR